MVRRPGAEELALGRGPPRSAAPTRQSELTAPPRNTDSGSPNPGQLHSQTARTLPPASRPASPHWQHFPPIRTVTAPRPARQALIGLDGSRGPRVTNLGAPGWSARARPGAPAEAFPSPAPAPPPPPGLWQRLTVPRGAHELVQHRAHLGLRRHGGGVAGGGGAPTGPWRAGDRGKGWGRCGAVPVAAAASRPASGESEGSRESPGCAPHDGVDVEDGSPLESKPSRPHSPSGS